MAGLKVMVTDMAAVVISAGASPGSTQIRTALSAILNAMENSGDLAGSRVDTSKKLWDDLRAARQTYLYAEAPDSTGNDLAGLATAITASVISAPQYGAIAVRNALVTLLNGWESTGDAGRVNTSRSAWLALHNARRLYAAERRGETAIVGGGLMVRSVNAPEPELAPEPPKFEPEPEPSKYADEKHHARGNKHK